MSVSVCLPVSTCVSRYRLCLYDCSRGAMVDCGSRSVVLVTGDALSWSALRWPRNTRPTQHTTKHNTDHRNTTTQHGTEQHNQHKAQHTQRQHNTNTPPTQHNANTTQRLHSTTHTAQQSHHTTAHHNATHMLPLEVYVNVRHQVLGNMGSISVRCTDSSVFCWQHVLTPLELQTGN